MINTDQWLNQICGDYRLVAELGSGTTGKVFLGESLTNGETVAVKIYGPSTTADKVFNNCRILQNCSNENLVEVFDCNRIDNHVYVAMEYVQYHLISVSSNAILSKNLYEYILEEPQLISEDNVQKFISQILNGIDYIKEATSNSQTIFSLGALHPNNILLEEVKNKQIILKLSNFSRNYDRMRGDEMDAYLSPEELSGGNLDERAMVFSLGAIIYLLLTGCVPQNNYIPPSELRNDISIGWDQIISQAMAYDVADRYQDLRSLKDAIAAVTSIKAKKVKKTKSSANSISFVIILLTLLGVLYFYKDQVKDFYLEKIKGETTPINIPDVNLDKPDLEAVESNEIETVFSDLAIDTNSVALAVETEVEKPVENVVTSIVEKAVALVEQKIVDPVTEKRVMVLSNQVDKSQAIIDRLESGTKIATSEVKPELPKEFVVSAQGEYIIVKGDTIWSVARRSKLTVNELRQINNLTTNQIIKIGQKLKVTKSASNEPVKAIKTLVPVVQIKAEDLSTDYVVQKGDTYYGLARKLGVKVKELQELNSNATLKVDQKIKVPAKR